jgi:hypothetical protein
MTFAFHHSSTIIGGFAQMSHTFQSIPKPSLGERIGRRKKEKKSQKEGTERFGKLS